MHSSGSWLTCFDGEMLVYGLKIRLDGRCKMQQNCVMESLDVSNHLNGTQIPLRWLSWFRFPDADVGAVEVAVDVIT